MKTTTNRADVAHDVTDEFREKAARVGEDIRELGAVAKETATAYYEQGVEKAKEFENTMEARIRDNPVQSVCIAAGVGFLAGFLIGRR